MPSTWTIVKVAYYGAKILYRLNQLEQVREVQLKAEVEQKVKAGWSREGAEASVLWENGIIDDDEFQALMKALNFDF
ncbi:hypothetical protein C7N43_06610 [Sphingobacteriales bacterium UPWRP_1]|nr:hypothetical protein BVG80_12655 [Sphingobacteriales bacterium TSM_CSM]PSJ77877.1 hypothetical protein C7N43_06610 [Sphingobacteriales bacterium UPWRP_1]